MTESKADQHDIRKNQIRQKQLRLLAHDALDAFWQIIVQRYPQAETGDLSPLTTFRLQQAAEAAIEEWDLGQCSYRHRGVGRGHVVTHNQTRLRGRHGADIRVSYTLSLSAFFGYRGPFISPIWAPRHPCRPGFSGLRFASVLKLRACQGFSCITRCLTFLPDHCSHRSQGKLAPRLRHVLRFPMLKAQSSMKAANRFAGYPALSSWQGRYPSSDGISQFVLFSLA
jgi:hypothetical protein